MSGALEPALPGSGLAVLSVVGQDGYPASSLIEFAANADRTIVFDAATDSRKHRAMAVNDKVSLVIGWDGEHTIQVQGRARRLDPEIPEDALRDRCYAELWPANHERSHGHGVFYVLVPHWIQWSDFAAHPPTVHRWEAQ